MEWIKSNWFNVVGLLIIVITSLNIAKKYMEKDKEAKIAAICEWLKYAVTVTESSLQGGTGKLKLQMAWSMATAQFPFITKVMDFQQFSEYVDDALDWMKNQIETNPNIKNVILGAAENNNQ